MSAKTTDLITGPCLPRFDKRKAYIIAVSEESQTPDRFRDYRRRLGVF